MSSVANIPTQTLTDKVTMNRTSVAEDGVIGDISTARNSECAGKKSFEQERAFSHIHVSVFMDCDDVEVLQKPVTLETDVVNSRFRRDAQSRVEDGNDVRFSLPATLPVSSFPEADDRKRPLSISSTSSSASSSSSLPRHVRKRMANMSSAAAAAGLAVHDASGYDASCETLSTVAECSPADVHCSPPAIRFFSKDIIEDRFPTTGLGNCPLDGIQATGSHQYMSQIADDYSANSDVDVEESTGSSARNSFNSLVPSSFDNHELKLFTGAVYIERVVSEILETERSYVKDLSDIVQGYIGHLRENSELELSSEVFEALFGNIETIWQFNRYFLTKLEQCEHDPIKIAGCFVSETDGFVIYSTYCTNYPRSMETLMRCMKDEKIATVLKQQQMSLQHGLPLGSYLLKPVQRILKYHILLQNIFNNHDTSEEGHAVIEKALDAMMKVALHINEMKRQHEHAVHIQEIQSRLCDWDGADLTTLGDLRLEEKFKLCGAKAMRHLYLFEKALLIAKEKEDGMLLVKGFILFSNLMVIESVPKEPLSFQVIPYDSPRDQCTFQANNLEQKRLWCHWLKKLMLENYGSKIPDKAKELVMMLGKSRDEEDYESSNLEIPELVKKQHSAPEYLEKRKDRRRKSTGGFIQDLKLKPKKGPKGGTSTMDTSKQKRDRCKSGGDRKSTGSQPVTDDEESFNVSCDDDNLLRLNISSNNSSINDTDGRTPPTSTSDCHKSDACFNSKDSFSLATSPDDNIRPYNEVISGIFSPPSISSVSAFPQVSRTLRTISVTHLQTPTHDKMVNEQREDNANGCYSPPQKSGNLSSQSAASLGRMFENVVGPCGSSFHRSNSVSFELQGNSNESLFSATWAEEELHNADANQSNSQGSEVINGKRFNSLRKLPMLPSSRASGANSLSQSALDEPINSGLSRKDDSSPEPAPGGTSPRSHLRSPSHGNICYGKLISITKLDSKYHTVERVIGRSPRAIGSQWPNVKPNNSSISNPENKDMFSRSCNDERDDGDDECDHLNSVRSALTRLSSKLPAESLQSISSCSTIRADISSGHVSTESPEISSGKTEERKDMRNRLARFLGRSPNTAGPRKVNKLLTAGNASCSSLADVLKDRHLAIGERMAISPDTTFNSVFTLVNRSPHPRPLLSDCKEMFQESQGEAGAFVLPLDSTHDTNSLKCDVVKSRSTPEFQERSNDKDFKVIKADLEKQSVIDKQVNASNGQFQDEKIQDSDEESYYENKLLQDLEDGIRTADCDDYEEIKSDDDDDNDNDDTNNDTSNDIKIIYTPTAKPSAHIPRMTIKETLHSIERRSHSRPVRKVELQLAEKAQGIREILHTLENSNKNGQESSGLYSMFPNKMPHRTVRDRTRELAVCAAITRVRQNNCNLSSLDSVAVEQDFAPTQNQCCDVRESRELIDESSHL